MAIILRKLGVDCPTEVLLTVRAQRRGDRWSGHVGLPGGMCQAGDIDLNATAARETEEEVRVRLWESTQLVGAMDQIRAVTHRGFRPMAIAPFVHEAIGPISAEAADEVTEVFWMPMELAASGRLDARHRHAMGPLNASFACWRWEGHTIWGLTYRMLTRLIALAPPRWRRAASGGMGPS